MKSFLDFHMQNLTLIKFRKPAAVEVAKLEEHICAMETREVSTKMPALSRFLWYTFTLALFLGETLGAWTNRLFSISILH